MFIIWNLFYGTVTEKHEDSFMNKKIVERCAFDLSKRYVVCYFIPVKGQTGWAVSLIYDVSANIKAIGNIITLFMNTGMLMQVGTYTEANMPNVNPIIVFLSHNTNIHASSLLPHSPFSPFPLYLSISFSLTVLIFRFIIYIYTIVLKLFRFSVQLICGNYILDMGCLMILLDFCFPSLFFVTILHKYTLFPIAIWLKNCICRHHSHIFSYNISLYNKSVSVKFWKLKIRFSVVLRSWLYNATNQLQLSRFDSKCFISCHNILIYHTHKSAP